MNNNMKREYISPELEILHARVERGFGGSETTTTALRGSSNEGIEEGNNYGNEIFS